MDWFRSYHGAPRDPRLRDVSAHAGVRTSFVVGTYWALLDHASQHRNSVASFDPEVASCFFGISEDEVRRIVSGLESEGFIVEGRMPFLDKQESRRYIPTAIRRTVFERDGYACVTCGATDRLSLDHIIAYSRGGEDTLENLQTMCTPCNSRKGARDVDQD